MNEWNTKFDCRLWQIKNVPESVSALPTNDLTRFRMPAASHEQTHVISTRATRAGTTITLKESWILRGGSEESSLYALKMNSQPCPHEELRSKEMNPPANHQPGPETPANSPVRAPSWKQMQQLQSSLQTTGFLNDILTATLCKTRSQQHRHKTHIPDPQKWTLYIFVAIKPLSFKVICYTAIDH